MKRGWILGLLLALPLVSAQDGIAGGIESIFSLLFNTGSADQIFIKIGIFLVFFGALYKGSQKVFADNTRMGLGISLVIALLGTRFIPQNFVEIIASGAGGLAAGIVGLGILLAPYAIISHFTQPGWFRRILTAVAIIVLLYAVSGASFIFPDIDLGFSFWYWMRAPIEIIEDIIFYFSRYPIWSTVITIVSGTIIYGIIKNFKRGQKGLEIIKQGSK